MGNDSIDNDLLVALLDGVELAGVRPCPVVQLKEKLSPEAADLLEAKLSDNKVPVIAIHRQLQRAGVRISRDSLTTHRRGTCRCGGQV